MILFLFATFLPGYFAVCRDHLLGTDEAVQQRASALFLLKLKESKRLLQVTIDDIVHEWDSVFYHTVQQLQAGIRAKLAATGIAIDDIEGLTEVLHEVPNPFEGLESHHKQEKYSIVILSDWW